MLHRSILLRFSTDITYYTTSYQSITICHTFARKKNNRPPSPTRQMRLAFEQLKGLKSCDQLLTFEDMRLKNHRQPVYSTDVLSAFYFWALAYPYVDLTRITKSSTHVEINKSVQAFLQCCRGRYKINKSLFKINNLDIFKNEYLKVGLYKAGYTKGRNTHN